MRALSVIWIHLYITWKSEGSDGDLPLSTCDAISLTTNIHGKGYKSFGNYNSYLFRQVFQTGFRSCDTVRLNRKGIPEWL